MTCCICSQIAGDASNDLFARAVGATEYVRRVPVESENFAVIPSLGPLVPGHVILCPKLHRVSFANVPSDHDEEFDRVLRNMRDLLKGLYSSGVHLFEHGMARDGSRVLCSVDHAHLHLVPSPVSVISVLEPHPSLLVPPGLAGLRTLAWNNEYLFYESPDGRRLLIRADDQQFESQYLRRVFAEALDQTGEWNWREHMKVSTAQQTYEILAAAESIRMAQNA
jgi:ATP adenylyltransferase